MSTEVIQSQGMDDAPLPDSDSVWQGTRPAAELLRALGSPLPPTVFEEVAVEDLSTADKKPKTSPVIETKQKLPTGSIKSKDWLEVTGRDIGSD